MKSKMFSPLARGTGGEWNPAPGVPGNFRWFEEPSTKDAHSTDPGGHSRFVLHDKQLFRTMPKTFTTDRGAMQIYTGEDVVFKERVSEFVHAHAPALRNYQCEDLPYKILQFGTPEDQVDPSCFKFSRPSYDDVFLDESTRPGALPEVYLEDLKHKTRCYNKNRAATPKLRPTERPRSVKYSVAVDLEMIMDDPQDKAARLTSAEKRRLLRPPSAPPQPMQSVQMRKNEIMRDHLKHIQAAGRREKQKFADFELVASLGDDFKVKGMGGPAKPRRAYSSPVYHTSKFDEKAFYIDDSKSLPLFIVKSSPFRAKSGHEQQRRNSQDYESVCFENYEKTSPTQYIDQEGRRVTESKDPISKTDDVVDEEVGVIKESLGALPDTSEHRTSVVSEATDRCSSSRQIVIDIPDQNKEKPRSPLISEELQKEIDQAAERAKEEKIPGAEIKNGEEVSSVLDESMQSVAARGVLTYPSFISLSSVNSTPAGEKAPVEDTSATIDVTVDVVDLSIDQSESQEDDLKIITVEIEEDCKAGSEETITNLERCPASIARRSGKRKMKTAKDIDSFKGAKGKLKQRPTGHIRRSKVGPGDVPIVSDGEYKDKLPPQSLVSIHKDVTSTDSLPKKGKKEKKNAARKKRELVLGDDTALDKQDIAGSQGDGIATEDDDAFSFHEPQTMLLDDDDDDTADSSLVSDRTPGGTRTIKKKERISRISRTGTKVKITSDQPSEETAEVAETAVEVMPDEVEDEFVFKQRQEDREREQLKIEKLEKQIGAADGSLKRLGEKVETLEKETNEQRERDAAERSYQKVEELAKKEEERRAYEEEPMLAPDTVSGQDQIMKAQEEEYERHLQNILAEEEERKRLYIEKLSKEMEQKDLKRKWALFRQSQNMELRQHVRLTKMKQKLTPPYKYSYFPLLKGTSLNDPNAEPAAKEAKTKKKMGVKKKS